ncbi:MULTISPECIES: hypothetical protein [Planomicrobium]|uniref:hypothetical protein n=1 Tax=Planomicrobium TaxID=162291 RepID=UPI000C7C15F1|nr:MULTISPECIES: hypothetical protein [Planomicrobium]PKH11187.1 hypothetical protein CXF70_05765 [Planomicrobium sp. MB-3u-38]
MQQYQGFLITIALILLIVFTSRYFKWWMKGIITIYYIAFAYIFITGRNEIDKIYEGILPVPEAYWDENSEWVYNMSHFLYVPLFVILVYIYIRWIMRVDTAWAKVLIVLTIIPVTLLFLFSHFFFNFGYGYRP